MAKKKKTFEVFLNGKKKNADSIGYKVTKVAYGAVTAEAGAVVALGVGVVAGTLFNGYSFNQVTELTCIKVYVYVLVKV